MTDKVKILITSAGSTNGVNVIKALKSQDEINFLIVAADANPLSAGFFLSDKYYVVPNAGKKDFVTKILEICKKEKIEIIIPTFSNEIAVFSKNKDRFEKKDIKVGVCNYGAFLDTEDKLKTIKWFKKLGILFPKTYNDNEIKYGKLKFPLIIKPVKSSGSKGIIKIINKKELSFYKDYLKGKTFIQEFINGTEYTIDGLCDLSGKMVAACPRIRLETKGGLAIKSVTKKNSLMVAHVKKIVEGIKITGPFNVQCFEKNGNLNFIEVNSRFPSGGLPLTVKAGFNIPFLFIKILLGRPIKIPEIKEGVIMVRYWDAFFKEEDQT